MSCGYRCHEIGGPWIAENPDCPTHGAYGIAEREREEEDVRNLVIEQMSTAIAEMAKSYTLGSPESRAIMTALEHARTVVGALPKSG